MLRSYENQVESSLSSYGQTCTDLGIGSATKGELKNLLKWGKFSFNVMVEPEK